MHANEFCATVAKKGSPGLPTTIPAERIPFAMSANLPEDIAVYEAKWVDDGFHARYDVIEKEYLYRIYNRALRSPFEEGRSAHVPKLLDDGAIGSMNAAAGTLLGTQDFAAYMAQGSKIVDTVRTVTRSEVFRDGDTVIYRVAANGFLYNMVRIITGTLVEIGTGKKEPAEMKEIIESLDRARAGHTAPAEGLYLKEIYF